MCWTPCPRPLQDRMEIIQLSSYTEDEKVKIVQGYLIPRQIKENGLKPDEVRDRPRPPCARSSRATPRGGRAQHGTARSARSAARSRPRSRPAQPRHRPSSTWRSIPQYLGRRKFHSEEITERTELPGVAMGLAWTMTGGDIMFFEATRVPGDKGFTVTGQLGDVMKESAQAALSYVRSRAARTGHRPGHLPQVGHPPAHPRRRHPQGWPQRGHHHGDGAGKPAHGPPRASPKPA